MRVFLVMRTRILCQDLFQDFNLLIIQSQTNQVFPYFPRNLNIQLYPLSIIHESTSCFRMTIGIHHVRLDVIDGSTIHQVTTLYMNDRTLACLPFDTGDFHGRQSDIVRTKRTAGSEYPDFLVTSQDRRSYNRAVCLVLIRREFPDKPEIIEALHSSEEIRIAILGFKNNLSFQFRHQSCLLGNTKLAAERRTESCYWFYFHIFILLILVPIFIYWGIFPYIPMITLIIYSTLYI